MSTALRALVLTGLVTALAVLPAAPAAAADTDPWIVVYERSVDSVDRATDARERRRGFRSRVRFKRAVEGFAAQLTDEQVRALRADPAVESVERDLPVRAYGAQPLATGEPVAPTGLRRIGLASSSAQASGWVRQASDLGVAVLDTGIDLGHPDLNVAAGTDCVEKGTPPEDGNGHGTHVAGTIGAENDGAGVTGVAPGTRVHPVRVLNTAGSGNESGVVCGIDWVLANATALRIGVINMSLGGAGQTDTNCGRPPTPDALHAAVCRAADAGILSVVAAGNEGADVRSVPNDDPAKAPGPGSPATYPEVLTVTAMNDHDGAGGRQGTTAGCRTDDRAAGYSNYATLEADRVHTIAAPGTCITSTYPRYLSATNYATQDGTSMATPHVAGSVALCLSEGGEPGPCAGLSPAAIIAKLRAEAEAFRIANPTSGFLGDPQDPLTGRYYGNLVAPPLPGPGTSFATMPADTTDDATPAFDFASGTPSVTFECSVDGGGFAPCNQTHEIGPMADGPHQLAVRAVDVAGNRDSTPASDSFTVDAVPDPDPPVATNSTPPDRTAPKASLGVATRQRIATVLRKGIRASVRCTEACRSEARVMLGKTTAGRKALRLGSGRRYVTVRLASSVRSRLARTKSSVLVQLRVAVTDAAGNTRTVKKSLRLTR